MKIRNSLDWISDDTLKNLIRWIAKRLDLPVKKIPLVAFATSRQVFGGLHQPHRIGVRIGKPANFPCTDTRDGRKFVFADQMEALVYVTAHELEHRVQKLDGRLRSLGRNLERITRGTGRRVLVEFRAERELLLLHWTQQPASETPGTQKPRRSIVEARAAKVNAKLHEWERKAKMAARKVRDYKQKKRYYDKKLASLLSHHEQSAAALDSMPVL